MLSNAIRGAVAVQQSRGLGKSEGPLRGRGSRHCSGPQLPLPQLLELGEKAELYCPQRADSVFLKKPSFSHRVRATGEQGRFHHSLWKSTLSGGTC